MGSAESALFRTALCPPRPVEVARDSSGAFTKGGNGARELMSAAAEGDGFAQPTSGPGHNNYLALMPPISSLCFQFQKITLLCIQKKC